MKWKSETEKEHEKNYFRCVSLHNTISTSSSHHFSNLPIKPKKAKNKVVMYLIIVSQFEPNNND